MKVKIQRDQAVWERETFEIEVADGLQGEDLYEEILCTALGFSRDDGGGYYMEVVGNVEMIDVQTLATLPDGTELAI